MYCSTILGVVFIVVLVAPGGLSWRRRRRRRAPPPCPARNCQVSAWTSWGRCSHQCGNAGTQTRTRRKTVPEACPGGRCPYHFSESQACNRNACRNGGQPAHGRCTCKTGYTGTCCERDVNECTTQRPCQHTCTNTYGSYTCRCNACYTKLGTRCDLRQCVIGGRCYAYGTINPGNPCQNCHTSNKLAWTNNNALRCSDGNACTRSDHCSSGRCIGTPFTCLTCEVCAADTCRVKPGYCTITENGRKTCYANKAKRPGYPCQECNSNSPHQWTNNNALPCSDGNKKTKNDRCYNGACKGTPYSCLPCETHDGTGCPLNAGRCIIQHSGTRTCFSNQQLKPGNPCQWCSPSASTSVWSNRNGVACNDGNQCTRADTCRNGMCTSTPFTCNSHCQVCNGNSCSQKPGFGFVAGKCTCKIAGKDYNHQVINPANQCQWCNLYDTATKPSSAWTNRPTVPCNDGNACTKTDKCNRGRCVGVAYSCTASYPSSSCVRTSVCLGDGRCRDIYRAANTICRAATDGCDQPEKCNGRQGACPGSVTDPITLRTGTAQLKNSAFTSAAAFQHTTSALFLRINGFTVSCGVMKYKWYLLDGGASCSTTSSTKGLLPNTNAKQTISSLRLLDNKSYKLAIQAIDMRDAARPLVCTTPVTIDTTRPSGGWVRDGTAADVSYQSTKLISANWGGFSTRHGAARYEWQVLYTPFRSSASSVLQSYTSVALNTRASRTFNNIVDGSTVKVQVRAFTKAGLYTERTSNGVIVDTTKPTTGAIFDGTQAGTDLKYAKWTNTYSVNWNAFTDIHSGIMKYQWAVKRAASSLITGYTNTALVRSGTVSGLSLVSGQSYCAVVRGYNKASLYIEGASNCVLIDHDAPRAGTVNDGSGSDVAHQSDGSAISANWNGFSDGAKGSGIVGYQYRITDASNTQIVGWTSVGLRTTLRHTGLALKNGVKYFVTVRATDAVGWTTDVKSNGVIVDTSRPVFTGVIKVTGLSGVLNGKACVYVTSSTTLQASWVGFSDGHSGLNNYKWAVIPASRAVRDSDLRPVSGSGLPTKASFSGLTLTAGSSYRVIIRATNHAFLYTDASSVVVIPDPSPPQPGQVSDGPTRNTDIDYQTSLNFVKATWTAFPEPHTQVKQYHYAIGSCIQGNYHVTGNRFLPVLPPTGTSVVYQNVTLVNGQKYCTKVKATNMAGLYSREVTSDGFIADITPPDVRKAWVIDGLSGTDIDYQHSLSEMSATWKGITDPESGIKNYEYGISRNRGSVPDVLPFRNAGLATTARVTGLKLTEDVYYFIVCAVNKAGLRKCLTSDGILIDHSPPHQGIVHDGSLEPDQKYQSSLTSIAANWEGIFDLESGIETFQWAVKENVTKKIAMDYFDVGLATHVKSERPLQLVNGKTYTVHLRYKNHAGAISEIVSNGITVDNTAPNPSPILPGTDASGDWKYKASERTYYASRSSQISAHWNPFTEDESEVWFYKWAIGTSKCGAQVQPLINIGSLTSANTTKSEQVFKYGAKYYVTVTSRNRANLVSRSCSDAFVLDNTPPVAGVVTISNPDKHQKYVRGDAITVHWKNFHDYESDVDYCDVFVNNMTNSGKVTTVSNATSGHITVLRSRFDPSQSHKAAVVCYNKAGLSSYVWSEGFIIDNTPPVSDRTVLVGVSRDNSKQYQGSVNMVTITWNPFTDPESPIAEHFVAMGTRALADDVIGFMSVGLATQFLKSDLKLVHNRLYYATVTAVNAAGLNTTVSGLPLLIDTTPPQGAQDSVKDGPGGEDWEYISPNDTIAAHWEGITDPESGIKKNRYCLGTAPYGCQLKSPTDIGTDSRFSCPACKLNPGEKIYVTVETINGAELSVTWVSSGMLVDGTEPRVGDVTDGGVPDVDMTTALRGWKVAAKWDGAEDKESGIKSCRWRIADERDLEVFSMNLTGPFKLGQKTALSSNQTYGSLNLTQGIYYNYITCENKAKLRSVVRSNGFRVVSQWPRPASVRDGVSDTDVDFSTSTKLIDANWDVFQADLRDPVVDYAWAVGTTAGQHDVSPFKSAGLNTHVEAKLASGDPDFQVLTPGRRYFTTVKATSASGLSSMSSSDGFIVDVTQPIKSEVRVSYEVSDQRRRNVEVTIDWTGVVDAESGILESKFCISTTANSCKTNAISAGNATSAVIPAFHPVSLASYYVTVIVQNNALLSTVMTSAKFSIDTSPPSQGDVIDGHSRDIDYANNTSIMTSQWGGFEDRDSGIKNCTWSLIEQSVSSDRASFGNDSVVFKQSAQTSERATRTGLSLRPGSRYINRITCDNRDGFTVRSDSDGVVIDVSAPVVGKVTDGNDVTKDIDFVTTATKVEALWQGFSDPESDVIGYRWALGTSAGKDDIIGFQAVGKSTKASAKNVTLIPGGHYYVTVEATNGAGMTSEGWSDGFIVEDTPPEIIQLTDGGQRWLGPVGRLSATWQSRDLQSGIAKTEYCVGTSVEGCQIQPMRTLPVNATTVTCLDCHLSELVTYYITVRVWNTAGMYTVGTTDGVSVDLTPPTAGLVTLNDDVTSCVTNCTLTSIVGAFVDRESGISACKFGIRNGGLKTPYKDYVPGSVARATGLTLVPGQRYFTVVSCTDNAGLMTQVVSGRGVLVDDTPPTMGHVIVSPDRTHDVYNAHSSCHLYNSTIRTHWYGFRDTQSGITGFRVAMGTNTNATNVLPFTDVGIVTSYEVKVSSNVYPGDVVYVMVEARNGAGLVTRAVSAPTRLVSADKEDYLQEGDFTCLNF